jgi:hypothetical protein
MRINGHHALFRTSRNLTFNACWAGLLPLLSSHARTLPTEISWDVDGASTAMVEPRRQAGVHVGESAAVELREREYGGFIQRFSR